MRRRRAKYKRRKLEMIRDIICLLTATLELVTVVAEIIRLLSE